jgi:hypothetical protein
MSKSLILSALLCIIAAVYSAAPLAADDPSPRQVYQAAEAGHYAQAEQMLSQVLKDHPRSGEAHYAAARVYAKAGDYSRARTELAIADQLEPGLPFAPAGAVAALRRELASTSAPQVSLPVARTRVSTGLPWGGIILVLIGIGLVWTLIRRRAQMSSYSTYSGNVPPGPGAPGYPGYGVPGAGGGPYYPGSGGGLMSSLGTGLAVGAGVAAGEELVHHVLDGNRSEGLIQSANADEIVRSPSDSDNMGGQDFGFSDSNSWDDAPSGDDGGSFDSGGGDSWT